jgi:Cytochrome c7 and related cytochrome c
LPHRRVVPPFRSYEHLLRLAAVFAAGAAVFLVLRSILVPADYGQLGHYRAGALTQIKARAIAYAGQRSCMECHTDVAETRKTNAHARIACESCHGPLAAHAADPSVAARKPDPRAVCEACHRPDPARSRAVKTVVFADHADAGPCTACHAPHAPKL